MTSFAKVPRLLVAALLVYCQCLGKRLDRLRRFAPSSAAPGASLPSATGAGTTGVVGRTVQSLVPQLGPHVLLLVTQGLEDLAVDHLVEKCSVSRRAIEVLPREEISLGEAAVGKIIVTLDDKQDWAGQLDRLQQTGVTQAVLAFVAAATGMDTTGGWVEETNHTVAKFRRSAQKPTGVLAEILDAVESSPHWPSALALLAASGLPSVRSFRASGASSGRKHAGFDCVDVMRAMGAGAFHAKERVTGEKWAVDLESYEVELFGTLCDGHFACGLLLGGEWRPNAQYNNYKFGVVPYADNVGRVHLENFSTPWFMPSLRASTSLLLLLLAHAQPGDSVLDPFGGSGKIAIEAATRFERVTSVSSDRDKACTKKAIGNVKTARRHLAAGASLRVYRWDARNISQVADGSVDRYVADLPFNSRCPWDAAAELPQVLAEVRRVLRPVTGRCVLLMQGYRRLESIVEEMNASTEHYPPLNVPTTDANQDSQDSVADPDTRRRKTLVLEERRNVAIGGYLAHAITLKVE